MGLLGCAEDVEVDGGEDLFVLRGEVMLGGWGYGLRGEAEDGGVGEMSW